MKLFRSNPWRGYAISRVFGAFFYHTETIPRSAPQVDSLYLRISRAGDPRVPIVRVIDQWLEEGRDVQNSELHKFIKQLRKYRRFKHALQVHSCQPNFQIDHGDFYCNCLSEGLAMVKPAFCLSSCHKFDQARLERVIRNLWINKTQ